MDAKTFERDKLENAPFRSVEEKRTDRHCDHSRSYSPKKTSPMNQSAKEHPAFKKAIEMAPFKGIKSKLYLSLLLQGVSMVLAWVFIDISAASNEGKDFLLSIFPLLCGILMTCGSCIAFAADKERRDGKRHIFLVVVTVAVLIFNYLGQIGQVDDTVIKWNVAEILVAIFDVVNILASAATILIVLQNPTCTVESEQ